MEYYLPRRIIVLILCWMGLFILHAMRVNVGITVVTILDEMSRTKVGTIEAGNSLPTVTWNSTMVGILHSIFYMGFILTQIPGGYITKNAYSSKVFGISILMSCLFNILLPISIQMQMYYPTLLIRFVQGLSEGLTLPALYRIMYLWFPNNSVHKYGGWIFGGMYAGPIFGFALDGFIIHYWKWYFLFYLHSLFGLIWFTFWYILIYETPNDHPKISDNEMKYITSHYTEDKDKKVPWKQIFKSKSVWAIVICNFVQSWMFILMLTNEPAYLNQFKFTLVENGIYSALPHVLKVVVAAISGYLSEVIIHNQLLSKTNTRKLFNSLGFGVESLSCFLLFTANHGIVAIVLLCIGVGFSGLTVSGWQINFLDISPEYASVLAGISATFGTVGGIINPLIIGVMTHPQILINWKKSFLVCGSVILMGTLFYAVFGTGVNQNWNIDEEKTILEETK